MKRNRPKTEKRIAQAARAIILESGFRDYGVNTVAARTGVDKVLIYRYFDGADGLLKHLGHTESLFPELSAVDCSSIQRFVKSYRETLEAHALANILNNWSQVSDNPLLRAFRDARASFWQQATSALRPQSRADEAFLHILACLPCEELSGAAIEPLMETLSFQPSGEVPASFIRDEPDNEELPTNLL